MTGLGDGVIEAPHFGSGSGNQRTGIFRLASCSWWAAVSFHDHLAGRPFGKVVSGLQRRTFWNGARRGSCSLLPKRPSFG
jgi:hypothetical protein